MKKGTIITLGVAIVLALAMEVWHINTTLQNRAAIKKIEAQITKN